MSTTPARPGWLYPAIPGLAIVLLLGTSTLLVVRARRLRTLRTRRTEPTEAEPPVGVGEPVGLVR